MAWTRLAACLTLCSLAACAAKNRPDLAPWPEIRSDFRVATLRARMYEYSITFAAEVDLASAAIERRATDATVRRNALLWRLRAIPEMRKACFRLEPVSGLIDAWTLARQMEQLFTDGAGKDAFGPHQAEAIAVSRRLTDQLRQIGGSIVESPEANTTFERRIIEPWLAEDPLTDLTFVRESPIARFADQSRESGDLSKSVGTMEELAIGLSQQLRIYMADLPRQARDEVDLMRSDILSVEGVASMQGDLHMTAAATDRIAGATDRIASTVVSLPTLVESERRIILDELSRQRAIVMAAFTLEREAATATMIQAFAVERGELLRNVESQRMATLAWASAERNEAIAQMRREMTVAMGALRDERVVMTGDLRGIVDMVLLRVALFLVAGVILAPLVAHVYARVWPRRRT